MSQIPVPVQLNVATNSEQYELSVSESNIPISFQIGTPIVAGTTASYEGPYSVTPTEEQQTLATDELKMDQDVTVGAIPTDYVGSDIPRRSSSDLTNSGGTVTVPAGHYAEDSTKSVGDATWHGTTQINRTPSISVDNNGLVTATIPTNSTNTKPIKTDGYALASHLYPISASGSNTLQLSTEAGKTVAPTELEQTAVAEHKYTTGNVKVGAISSTYVGSGIDRNDSSNLTASGKTVTAPAGYYPSAATKDIADATWRSASTIGAVPDVSVDSSGLITANCSGWTSVYPLTASGYADSGTSAPIQIAGVKTSQLATIGATTYTPAKGTVQTIPLGKFLTGDQTISAIPDSWYDMGGALAWLGAGAELVTTFTLADVKLSATDFDTWTPSTTAADILATRNAGTFTATDTQNWNYYIVWETKIPIEYASAGTNKAKPLFLASIIINAIFRRPSSYDNIRASSYNNTVNATAYTGNFLRYYGSTANSMTYTYNASYGLYGAATAATLSSATADSPTVTAKTPKISARCSTTYMSTANAGYIDKDKTIISQNGYVYKAKRSTFLQGCYEREIAFVNEVDA